MRVGSGEEMIQRRERILRKKGDRGERERIER
jgi:hypothetical protein